MKSLILIFFSMFFTQCQHQTSSVDEKKITSLIEYCNHYYDSSIFGKLTPSTISNLEILNGINCFKYNDHISNYDFSKQQDTFNNLYLLTFDSYTFKNIEWTPMFIFKNNSLKGFQFISGFITLADTKNFYNDYLQLLGNPTTALHTLSFLTSNEYYIPEYCCKSKNNPFNNQSNINFLIKEITSPQKGFIEELKSYTIPFSLYTPEEYKLNKKMFNDLGIVDKVKYEKINCYDKISFNCIWLSKKNKLDIIFERNSPFTRVANSSIAEYTYSPHYQITLRYFENDVIFKQFETAMQLKTDFNNNIDSTLAKHERDSIKKDNFEKIKNSFK